MNKEISFTETKTCHASVTVGNETYVFHVPGATEVEAIQELKNDLMEIVGWLQEEINARTPITN